MWLLVCRYSSQLHFQENQQNWTRPDNFDVLLSMSLQGRLYISLCLYLILRVSFHLLIFTVLNLSATRETTYTQSFLYYISSNVLLVVN